MNNKNQTELPEIMEFKPKSGVKVWLLLLVGVPAIFTFGILVNNTNDEILGIVAGYIISGIAALGGSALMLRIVGWGIGLRLQLDGFVFRQFGRSQNFRWVDTDNFTAVRFPGSEYIMFSLIGAHHGAPNLSERLMRIGRSAGLVNYYGIKGEELGCGLN